MEKGDQRERVMKSTVLPKCGHKASPSAAWSLLQAGCYLSLLNSHWLPGQSGSLASRLALPREAGFLQVGTTALKGSLATSNEAGEVH